MKNARGKSCCVSNIPYAEADFSIYFRNDCFRVSTFQLTALLLNIFHPRLHWYTLLSNSRWNMRLSNSRWNMSAVQLQCLSSTTASLNFTQQRYSQFYSTHVPVSSTKKHTEITCKKIDNIFYSKIVFTQQFYSQLYSTILLSTLLNACPRLVNEETHMNHLPKNDKINCLYLQIVFTQQLYSQLYSKHIAVSSTKKQT